MQVPTQVPIPDNPKMVPNPMTMTTRVPNQGSNPMTDPSPMTMTDPMNSSTMDRSNTTGYSNTRANTIRSRVKLYL